MGLIQILKAQCYSHFSMKSPLCVTAALLQLSKEIQSKETQGGIFILKTTLTLENTHLICVSQSPGA